MKKLHEGPPLKVKFKLVQVCKISGECGLGPWLEPRTNYFAAVLIKTKNEQDTH